MSIKISGILPGPTGEPAAHIGITLRAIKTSLTVITTLESNSITGTDGAYSLNVEPGKYDVLLWVDGINARRVGTINVYSDSLPGTLNNFLTALREEDGTPEIILQLEQLRAEAVRAALEAKESKNEATQQAGIAISAADNAAQETAELIKAAVKEDADRAEAARYGAETAQSTVNTLAAEVARHHSEVGQLASTASNSAAEAASSSNSSAQSASESESSKNAAALSEQSALAGAEDAGNSATAAAGDKTAAKGFRDEAEEFAARAKASAESIDVSALEEQINQKVSQTEFDDTIADKASNQALTDGLATKASTQQLTDGLAGKLDKIGGTLTGPLILAGDATDQKGAVTKQQLDKSGGDYLLSFRLHTNRARIPAGYGAGDGQILTRAVWPDAWAAIDSGEVPLVSDAVWLSDVSKRGCYSTGDGSTTFRMPDYNGIQPGSIKAPYFRGDGGLTDGDVQSSALPNIKGTMTGGNAPATASGVFSLSGASSINGGAGSSFTARFGDVDFSAARYNPIYKDEVNEVRTNAVVGCYIIRLAGSYLNTGSIDAAALAASISALSARVGVLEAKSQLFTIMYPEGTPSSPYSFPVNTRRVYVNPFPGRVVKCVPEVYVNGAWGDPGWIYYYSTATAGSFGTAANQTDTLANIVVVSGTVSLSAASNTSGSPHNSNTSPTTALPLRIKVFTIDGGA
ncbi:TPA: prophage tail fiber N-terminal domain-containing protein [Yersinia enterocolitica]|uniref:prophage tail fiber N-terminal domain-containing protein n=1 Tax=Yersinia enterocolitica TaxID=630 RepID=UPI0029C5E07A|nr:prophage tail fiber N-terminal domain-containing protein [Yersinia enterocolitica]HEN3233691.1 prophage tail fiber N-terminal domain-containing protein [Yersinia enterocolitica]